RGLVDMEDNLEVEPVQGGNVLGRLVKRFGIKVERAVADVPSGGTIAGAQVDEGVAGQSLVAEGLGDLGWLLWGGQRAVRLHVSPRPLRRHDRPPSQANIFRQRVRGLLDVYHEYAQRLLAARFLPWQDLPPAFP